MECKSVRGIFIHRHWLVLIETLWNVNIWDWGDKLTFLTVLIETLWNVNTDDEEWKRHINNVLIETLWNVNYSSSCSQTQRTFRINRNIVECK